MSMFQSPLEAYKAKKIAELTKINCLDMKNVEDFLSQTIDELWALPEKRPVLLVSEEYDDGHRDGWNACIAEAERMRDNKLNKIYV